MNIIALILLTVLTIMSCGNNPKSTPARQNGAITMNLYYTGTDGNARKIVEEQSFIRK